MNTALPEGPFGAILADPPWKFEAYSKRGLARAAERRYATAGLDELASLPVADVAHADCALFMWVVDSHLPDALALMAAWGFAYKTIAFWWGKQRLDAPHGGAPGELAMGLGYWTRKQCEPCLLGCRGRPIRRSGGVRQAILAPRREHSRKPDEIYTRIEALVRGPYLEIFARQRWPGWSAWGDEVGRLEPGRRGMRGASAIADAGPLFGGAAEGR